MRFYIQGERWRGFVVPLSCDLTTGSGHPGDSEVTCSITWRNAGIVLTKRQGRWSGIEIVLDQRHVYWLRHGEPKTGSMFGISLKHMTGCSAIFLVKQVGPVKIALMYFILGSFHKGPVTHTITHVQRSKNWTISVCALWFAGRASEFVDDCTRTPDERCSFIVCVNSCVHSAYCISKNRSVSLVNVDARRTSDQRLFNVRHR